MRGRITSKHQSVIGRELKRQIEDININIEALIACVGGGSNAIGFFYPWINSKEPRLIGVEAGGKSLKPGEHASRMVGNGRPFVVEVKRPRRRHVNLEEVARAINESGKVEVLDLRFITSEEVSKLLSTPHKKEYLALVYVEEGITPEEAKTVAKNLTGAEIRQRTPHRVERSRADKVRVRRVHKAEAKCVDERHFELRLVTDGGLYIKELISGDEGRTSPSVAELLGKKAVCERLDVLNILDEDYSYHNP
jgi:tRNA U54 and U55 pseudouridine synthase Pus10